MGRGGPCLVGFPSRRSQRGLRVQVAISVVLPGGVPLGWGPRQGREGRWRAWLGLWGAVSPREAEAQVLLPLHLGAIVRELLGILAGLGRSQPKQSQ